MSNAMETISVAYNGEEISKLDLLMYLNELISLREKINQWERDRDDIQTREQAINLQRKRRTYYEPVVEKPTGLAALSGSKRREYQRWLDSAPERQQKREQFEVEETARLEALEAKKKELEQEYNHGFSAAMETAKKFQQVCLQHILAPEYRKDDIPKILFLYLFNGRANTLEAAINLYHQELHYQKLEDIAKEQARQARASHYAQMQVIREAQEEQNQELSALREELTTARRAAENASFNTEMLFWLNLIDK